MAKFVIHKVKSRIYKARTNLKAVSVQSLFPGSSISMVSETTARPKGIYINENLTPYHKEMMSLTVEKRHDGKINKVWTLDGKIFIKTTPTGNPRQMFSLEDVMSKNFKSRPLKLKGRTAGPSRNTRTAYQTD